MERVGKAVLSIKGFYPPWIPGIGCKIVPLSPFPPSSPSPFQVPEPEFHSQSSYSLQGKVSCRENNRPMLCLCKYPDSHFSLTRGNYAAIKEMLFPLFIINAGYGGKGHTRAVYTTGTWESPVILPSKIKRHAEFLVRLEYTRTASSNTNNASVPGPPR